MVPPKTLKPLPKQAVDDQFKKLIILTDQKRASNFTSCKKNRRGWHIYFSILLPQQIY